jgi:hypothetical protein
MCEAIRKYGPDNFTVEKIEETDDLNNLDFLEASQIISKDTLHPNGYNAIIPSAGEFLGKQCDQTRIRQSHAMQGNYRSDSQKYVGVLKFNDQRYGARITHYGDLYYRCCPTEIEAAIWYDKMALYLYGEKAKINLEDFRSDFLRSDLNKFFKYETQNKTTSKYVGVYWNVNEQKWKSAFFGEDSIKILGGFNQEILAAEEYDKYIFSKTGRCVNFPENTEKYRTGLISVAPVCMNKVKTSKYKGVSLLSKKNLWESQYRDGKQRYSIKRCKTEEEAARCVDKFAIYFKSTKNMNFPVESYDIQESIGFVKDILNRQDANKTRKYKGVTPLKLKTRNVFEAKLHLRDRSISLGRYKTEDEAAMAIDLKRLELFGESCLEKLFFKESLSVFNNLKNEQQ